MTDLFTNQNFILHLTTNYDVAAATVKKILYKKPTAGVTGFWTPVREDATKIKYEVTTADIGNDSGIWEVQAYIEEAGGIIRYGSIFKFQILRPIS